ncbi:MAG: hypothetical protein LBG15_14105 [Dysgonamonadaceae bacterium]|jgi:hypothetical protein|nr:hypothetical protein [Dysgonamonadaceae bacterium]
MKTKLLLSLFAIGLLAFNFSFKNGKTHESRLTLRNIALMQANAFEVICEAEDSSPCTYTVVTSAGSITGVSTGPMSIYP